MDQMPSATKPSPLPLPKQQLRPLPPKPLRLQLVLVRFPPVHLSPLLLAHVPPAGSEAERELTLLPGLLGGRGLRSPRAPRIPSLRAAEAARRRGPPRATPPRSPPPPPSCRGGLLRGARRAGLLCSAAGCWRRQGVSGCHGDCGSSPPPAAPSRSQWACTGDPRAQEGAGVGELQLLTDQSKVLSFHLSLVCLRHQFHKRGFTIPW